MTSFETTATRRWPRRLAWTVAALAIGIGALFALDLVPEPAQRDSELPPAEPAGAAQAEEYEKRLPALMDRMSVADGKGGIEGAFHRLDESRERELWKIVSTLGVYEQGAGRLLETIDRVYLARHENFYHGWTWHYPYFDCFKAVALARKVRREYPDPGDREAALWREAYCYRVRGLDGEQGSEDAESSASKAQSEWRSDLDRARELLQTIVDEIPEGEHAAAAADLLRFGISEIELPEDFPSQRSWIAQLRRRCSESECRQVQLMAARVLARLGDEGAVAAVLEAEQAATDAELREAALAALEALDPRAAAARRGDISPLVVDLDTVSAELQSPSPNARVRALQALGTLGTDGGEHASTVAGFLDDQMIEVREAAFHALAALSPAESIPLLLARLDSWSVPKILVGVELGTGGVLSQAIADCVAGRLAAEDVARLWRDSPRMARRALPLAVAASAAPEPAARARMATVLGRLAARGLPWTGDVAAVAEGQLRELLEDQEASVRRAAAAALGHAGRPLAPETSVRLAAASRDADENVRGEAVGALAGTGEATAVLLAGLRDDSPEVRATAARSLSSAPSPEAVPALAALFDDPDLAVRAAAIRSLAHFGELAEPAADRLAEIAGGDDPDLGLESVFVLEFTVGLEDPRYSTAQAAYVARHGLPRRDPAWLETRLAAAASPAAVPPAAELRTDEPRASGPRAGGPRAGEPRADSGLQLRHSIPTPPGTGDPAGFGYSLTASAERIVVGAYMSDRVFVFDATSGELLHTLEGRGGMEGPEFFGAQLAATEDLLAVGAPERARQAGGIDLFDAGGRLLRRLEPPEGTADLRFGSGLALSPGRLLVAAGAPGYGVDLFDPTTGARLRKIPNPDPEICRQLGPALAFLGNRLVVGAETCRGYGIDGRVYVFGEKGEAILVIENPDPGQIDLFGGAVAVLDGEIAVAARQDSTAGERAGAVYVFDSESGGLRFALINPEPGQVGSFGATVAAVGPGLLAVGAPGKPDAEKVFLFDSETGEQLRAIDSAYEPPYRNLSWSSFGTSLAAVRTDQAEFLAVGAPTADPSGFVFVFQR